MISRTFTNDDVDKYITGLNSIRHNLADSNADRMTPMNLSSACDLAELLLNEANVCDAKANMDELRGLIRMLDNSRGSVLQNTLSEELSTTHHSNSILPAKNSFAMENTSKNISVDSASEPFTRIVHSSEDFPGSNVSSQSGLCTVGSDVDTAVSTGSEEKEIQRRSILKNSGSTSLQRRVSFAQGGKLITTYEYMIESGDDCDKGDTYSVTATEIPSTNLEDGHLSSGSGTAISVNSALLKSDQAQQYTDDNDASKSIPYTLEQNSEACTDLESRKTDLEVLINEEQTSLNSLVHKRPVFEVVDAGSHVVNGVYAPAGNFMGKTRYRKLRASTLRTVSLTKNVGDTWGLILGCERSTLGHMIIERVIQGSIASECAELQPPVTLVKVNEKLTAKAASNAEIKQLLRQEDTIHLVLGSCMQNEWFDIEGSFVEIRWDWDSDDRSLSDTWPNDYDLMGYWIGLYDEASQKKHSWYYNPANSSSVPDIGWQPCSMSHAPPPSVFPLANSVDEFSNNCNETQLEVDGAIDDSSKDIDIANLSTDKLAGWLQQQGVSDVVRNGLAFKRVGGKELLALLTSERGRTSLYEDLGISQSNIQQLVAICRT